MSRNEREWKLANKFSAFSDEHIYPFLWPGAKVDPIEDEATQRTHGDKRIILPDETVCVDEKAYKEIWDGCLIELIQDIRTKDMGWFYDLEHCDYLICGYYQNEDDLEPDIIYKVHWAGLKMKYLGFLENRAKGIFHYISPKGYGLTLFSKVPWNMVAGVSEVVWRKP